MKWLAVELRPSGEQRPPYVPDTQACKNPERASLARIEAAVKTLKAGKKSLIICHIKAPHRL